MNKVPKVSYRGKEYEVVFTHDRAVDANGRVSAKGGVTYAHIEVPAGGDAAFLISHQAECSPSEGYNRRLGREVSLGRLKKRLKVLDVLNELGIDEYKYDKNLCTPEQLQQVKQKLAERK